MTSYEPLHNVNRKSETVNYALGMVHFNNGWLTHFARLLTLIRYAGFWSISISGGLCEVRCFRYFSCDMLLIFC